MKSYLIASSSRRFSFNAVLLTGLMVLATGCENNCQNTTTAWEQMGLATLRMIGPNNQKLDLLAKLADSRAERSAGFQYICPSTIERYPMYFDYGTVAALVFHMRNVVGELDIAFINVDHRIGSIQRMVPYKDKTDQRYYRPNGPVIGALEARPGFFSQQGITPGWTIHLQQADVTQ